MNRQDKLRTEAELRSVIAGLKMSGAFVDSEQPKDFNPDFLKEFIAYTAHLIASRPVETDAQETPVQQLASEEAHA